MMTTMRLPNALLQYQAAVITDFIVGGACRKANASPVIDSHISPNIIKKNCGNCHKIDSFAPVGSRIVYHSISYWSMPAQTNDSIAHRPPNAMHCNGDSSMLHRASNGTHTDFQNGIMNNRRSAPTPFAYARKWKIFEKEKAPMSCTNGILTLMMAIT